MTCAHCHHENPTGVKFCGECGGRLEARCPQCGIGNPPGNKFCHECGTVLVVAGEPRRPSPESYTPRHLADKILTSRTALEGERKQVTVFFCDIVSSTTMAERVDSETMHALLNRFFELALTEVHRYEGTINQFLGDGFMALFGAPVAHEDHARRAVADEPRRRGGASRRRSRHVRAPARSQARRACRAARPGVRRMAVIGRTCPGPVGPRFGDEREVSPRWISRSGGRRHV